jgi:hypothetical protein
LNTATKYALGLILIGTVLVFMPWPNQQGTIFSTFFGSPWIQGFTGQISGTSGTGGTNQQATLLTSGTVNFKMSLVSTYTDNSTETLLEKSTLPGLAIISIHGKTVREITAYALIAVTTNQPMPSGTVARFESNFTSCIQDLNRCKWNYQVTTSTFVGNNTSMAAVGLPPFAVLPIDVYPTALASGTVASRRVTWTLTAHVTATPPGYNQLNLLGDTYSYADLSYDGSITGACTDCAGSGSIIGGGISLGHGVTPEGGTPMDVWYLTNPADYCTHNPGDSKCGTPPLATGLVTETYTNVVGYITGGTTVEIAQTGTRTGTGTIGGTTAITGTLAPPTITSSVNIEVDPNGQTTTTYVTTDHSTGKTTTQKATTATETTLGSHTYVEAAPNTSPTGGAGYKPGQQGVIMELLPLGPSIPLTWTRLDMGSTVYLVNPGTWILVGLFVLAFAAIILSRRHG